MSLISAVAVFGCGRSATVEERLAEYGRVAHARLLPCFTAIGIPYPPKKITLIGLKEEKKLEVHALGADGTFSRLVTYPILAASGTAGPKLKEGDRQVPEGFYKIESLNPNSRFHLSLRVNYPNAEDRKHARDEKRTHLGGDIMIHGNRVSVGCLAMGDPAAEELFVLVAETGIANVEVVLCPVDFRRHPDFQEPPASPPWTADLYRRLKTKLAAYKP